MFNSQMIGIPLFDRDGQPFQGGDKMLAHVFGRPVKMSQVVQHFRDEPARMERLLAEAATLKPHGRIVRRQGANSNRERLAEARRRIAHEDGRWATAVHEGAHAYMMWHVGAIMGLASIVRNESTLGRVRYDSYGLNARQHIQVLLAGPIAERFATKKTVEGFSLQRCADGTGDGHAIDEIMRTTGCGERVYQDAVKRCQERIPTDWKKIDSVARELVAREFLKPADIKRICESN